ncbi:uncharacterized protein DUF3108 [Pseudoduganella flava]|uniref:DUF3108 domain-containing protein n=1 Tax=Pseudoduganella flava TaxID=871742 RepID=A0A562PLP0_9BURK|nr:DUF3108 domain-containing protein [Pseudoduganella flava]QGZ40969.1 DUF3108 domain-containing protein [Pseudoduganella flava]TWI45344.1 uncharacterized protein DUF3108 [Pseudoduganella flava]
MRSIPHLLAVALAAVTTAAVAQEEHPSVKRKFDLPPSAELTYTVKVNSHGIPLSGTGVITWQQSGGKYLLVTEARSAMFGKVLENRSEGTVDAYGLAPDTYFEKRIRKGSGTTTFKRDAKTIDFADNDKSVPLKGGEQDRSSAPWQLAAVARATPDKFTPGSEWKFYVAGRRSADTWSFKVVGTETVRTAQGDVQAVHFSKAPPQRDKGQQVDLWLAPSLEWYPVRLVFTEDDGDSFEQLLEKVAKK